MFNIAVSNTHLKATLSERDMTYWLARLRSMGLAPSFTDAKFPSKGDWVSTYSGTFKVSDLDDKKGLVTLTSLFDSRNVILFKESLRGMHVWEFECHLGLAYKAMWEFEGYMHAEEVNGSG